MDFEERVLCVMVSVRLESAVRTLCQVGSESRRVRGYFTETSSKTKLDGEGLEGQ